MNMLFEKNIQINNKNTKNSKKNLPKVNDNENNNSSNETSHLSNPSQSNKQQNAIYKISIQNKVRNTISKEKYKNDNRKCSSRGENQIKIKVKEKIVIESHNNRRNSINNPLKLAKIKKNMNKKVTIPILNEKN